MSVEFEHKFVDGVWQRRPKRPVGWAIRYELKTDTFKEPANSYPDDANADAVHEIEVNSATEALVHALTNEPDTVKIQVFVAPVYDPAELEKPDVDAEPV